jgi:hypothetical protein
MKLAALAFGTIFAAAVCGTVEARQPGWKPCTTGWNPETATFKTLPPKWARKLAPGFDPHDGHWQHVWCNSKTHKMIACFYGSSDEELAACDRELGSAASSSGIGTMRCAEVNRPHDPGTVRAWLRGYLTGANYGGDYQDAAAGIGAICQSHPLWSLTVAAQHWVNRAH